MTEAHADWPRISDPKTGCIYSVPPNLYPLAIEMARQAFIQNTSMLEQVSEQVRVSLGLMALKRILWPEEPG
jgi:hypothetical protein